MATANPWKRDMDGELERLLRLHTDQFGEIDVDAVINDMAVWLLGNPSVLAAEAATIARRTFDAFDRSHRPKSAGAQFGLFAPQNLIPIGKNQRVWMEHATREHLVLWAALDDAEFAASATAQAAKSAYRASRLQAWTPQHATLIDVERDAFGWP